MKSRLKPASLMLLIAILLSFVPAAVTASPASAATCDWAQFVSDVTVPDGTTFAPNAAFKKTWRLKNIGTCTWTTSYSMVFASGAQMGTATSVAMPSTVAPGQTVDVSVDLTAPSTGGSYRGFWKFKNASGTLFGIGFSANQNWWVDIKVTGPTTLGVVYDFTAQADKASWSSGAGGLTFPGTDGDAKGFVLKKDTPIYEGGFQLQKPGLLVAPQNVTNGYIQAVYPAFKVQAGDRFQTTVGCENAATSCYVAYRLDYQIGTGTTRTFWTFRERYEGLTYNLNLSLGSLSGQDVKFTLYLSAYGSPVGDRAYWGNPVIVRPGAPVTPGPTSYPPPVTVTVPPSACDKVQFVADVNYPDGTTVAPGAAFTKTWRLKNIGTCPWTTSYQLVFYSGEQMGAPATSAFSQSVAVGQTFDFSVNMTAPTNGGSYRGYWMFKNASGTLFGIGTQGNKPWWVDIKVSGPTATPGGPTKTPTPTSTGTTGSTAYDFAANACKATWVSRAASTLPCPGTDGDKKGFVLQVSNPKLETGATDTRPGLITFPSQYQNGQDGYIQGFYPPFKVQSGDRFRATINCEGGATLCYVAFRLDYQTGTDPIKTFWGPFVEKRDSPTPLVYNVDVNLSSLAGKDVKFILTVLSAGTETGDRALWVGPQIFRPGAITPIPPTTYP